MDRNDGWTEKITEEVPAPLLGVKLCGGGGGHSALHLRTQGSGAKANPWIGLVITSNASGEPSDFTASAHRMHVKADVFEQFLLDSLEFVRSAKRGEITEVSV